MSCCKNPPIRDHITSTRTFPIRTKRTEHLHGNLPRPFTKSHYFLATNYLAAEFVSIEFGVT
ncbi:hypothetical protein PFISCL1PPCAC_27705 [Pristionchus fissidentatus]|uniref:Uncharacterized protein n=1 Tax=Pristionchus fissidentatus TaxID=1538716 RepID=A0AAV5WYJ8_9BILA|nr:hypothetical protein PFISCL1PPCAC_27705 [Pristionchus fissidentatus]